MKIGTGAGFSLRAGSRRFERFRVRPFVDRTVVDMTDLRRGAVAFTESPEQTSRLCEAMAWTHVASLAQLLALPAGQVAVLDVDVVEVDVAIEAGARFRAAGVRLVVAALRGQLIPFELSRNLEVRLS